MYRFDQIESLAIMKNVCLYIRIYNEIEKQSDDILELDVRDYIREKYNKDIPLFDLAEFRRLAKSFTKEGNIPSLLQLDEIIAVYIKNIDKKAKELYKTAIDLENDYVSNKHMTKDGFMYSSKELAVLERPVSKQLKSNVFALFFGALLIGLAMIAIAYPILSKFDIDLTSVLIKNKTVALYLPIFTGSMFLGLVILWLALKKNIFRALNVYVLINSKIGKIERLERKIDSTKKEFDGFIKSIKLVKFVDGRLQGVDKLNYFLRIDNQFVADEETNVEEVAPERKGKKEISNNEVKIKNSKEIEVEGWANSQFSGIEKKNCNLDLIARIGLITDSIKANGETDSKEFGEVINIYCNELSSESRETSIVKQTSQLKMYEFYLSMVEKLEPYEKLCKDKFGLDFDGEKYSYRVASEEEKNAISGYLFSIIENQFSSSYYADKFKDKVYTKYNDLKIDFANVNKRSELYKLYIGFIKDFKKRIEDYLR
ncbi:MAG: hypothetical protein J6J23_04105 [Clostridia bacterium]|nr:hypothetical protein [Clostridia bacterium]